jgi:phosphoribosylamine---glycine ligase
MNLLVIDSKNANGLDFVMRAQRDGHSVRWFYPKNEKNKWIGEGLVNRIEDFAPSVRWADLIVLTDNTTYLHNMAAARREGVAVCGATVESAEWELDRTVGMQMLMENQIEVPAYKEFNHYDDAIRHVKKHDRPFVSKPSGDADKALSYVAQTPTDMLYMLERWKKNSKLKPPFILQEKVEGIEMAVGGWFGPHGWNDGWCENWEFKKLCTGNLGCATGEQGTVLRYVRSSKLARQLLLPLTDDIRRTGHVGYVDINCIIDEKGHPWPLEFTMRPGWPTMNIQQELHQGDSVEWLMALTDGIDAHNLTEDTIAIGVVLSVPDYPYSHLTRKEVVGIPVYGLTPEIMEHVHPCEMMECEAPQDGGGHGKCLGTAGDYVLVMSGTGETVRSAQTDVYRRLKRLVIPNSPMWRIDIGDRLKKELPLLQKHKYAMSMSYQQAPTSSTGSPTKPSTPSKDVSMNIGQMQIIYV